MPTSACRTCGKVLDAATDPVGENAVTPGSLSVCFYCGEVGVFDENLLVRAPNAGEMEEIGAHPLLGILQSGIRELNAPRRLPRSGESWN